MEKERTAEPPELNGHGDSSVERQMSPVAAVPSSAAVKEAVAGAKDVPSVAVTTSATKEEDRPQQSYLGGFAKIRCKQIKFLHIFFLKPDLENWRSAYQLNSCIGIGVLFLLPYTVKKG